MSDRGSLVSPSPLWTTTVPCWNRNNQLGTWWRLNPMSSLRHSHGGTGCGKESWWWGGCTWSVPIGDGLMVLVKKPVWSTIRFLRHGVLLCVVRVIWIQPSSRRSSITWGIIVEPSTWLDCHLQIRVLNVFSIKDRTWWKSKSLQGL